MKKTILLFSLGVLSPAVAAFADTPAADAKAGLLARAVTWLKTLAPAPTAILHTIRTAPPT